MCTYWQYFNHTTNGCNNICESPRLFDQAIKKCLLPNDFYRCEKYQNWDNSTKKCYNVCAENYIFNYLKNKCEIFACPDPHMRMNLTSNTCYCQHQFIFNDTTQKCQQNCQVYGEIFNKTSNNCQCHKGYAFSFEDRNCTLIPTCATNHTLCPKCDTGFYYDIEKK